MFFVFLKNLDDECEHAVVPENLKGEANTDEILASVTVSFYIL